MRYIISVVIICSTLAWCQIWPTPGPAVSLPTNTVATPADSPGQGTYPITQTVTLACGTSGATICYTVDGITTPEATTPGTCSTGTTYSSAFDVSETTTIKAIGTKSGMTNSYLLTSVYTISATENVGYTGVPTPLDAYVYSGYRNYFKLPATGSAGSVTSIKLYVGTGACTQTKVAIYTDTGGVTPNALVAASNELSQSANGWNTYTFASNPSVGASTVYWICFITNTGCSSLWNKSGGTHSYKYAVGGYSFPDPGSISGTNSNYDFGLYMVVQP